MIALLVGCGSAAKPYNAAMKPPFGDESAELASLSDEEYEGESRPDELDQSLRPDLSFVSARNRVTDGGGTTERASAGELEDKSTISIALSDHQDAVTGKVEHVGEDDFGRHVLKSDVPVLVDFYADWCGPCKKLGPTLDRIARQTPGAKVVKVNIDHSPDLARRYGVRSIPTVLVFKDGEAVARNTGLADESTLKGMLGL
jgi:thioredoxin 1